MFNKVHHDTKTTKNGHFTALMNHKRPTRSKTNQSFHFRVNTHSFSTKIERPQQKTTTSKIIATKTTLKSSLPPPVIQATPISNVQLSLPSAIPNPAMVALKQPLKRPASMPTGPPSKATKVMSKSSNNITSLNPATAATTAATATAAISTTAIFTNPKLSIQTKKKKSRLPLFQFEKQFMNDLYLKPPSELSQAQFITLLKVTPPQHFQTHLDHFNGKLNETFGHTTPLIAVTAKGKLDMMKELHTRGAQLGITDSTGDTPLHVAIKGGNVDVIRWLLARGADAHQINNLTNLSPLMTASKTFHHAVAELLLEHNTNSNQQNSLGQTALMLAAQFSSRQMIETLHSYGADVDLFDNDGYSAYDYANMHRGKEMTSILHLCYSGKRKPKFNPLTPEILARKKERELKQEAFELRDQIFDNNGRFLPQFIELIWRSVQHSEIYMQTGLFPDSVEIVVKKHKDHTRHFTSHQANGISANEVTVDEQRAKTGNNGVSNHPFNVVLPSIMTRDEVSNSGISHHDPFAGSLSSQLTTNSTLFALNSSHSTNQVPTYDNGINSNHNAPQNEAVIISPDGSIRPDHHSQQLLNNPSPFNSLLSHNDPFLPGQPSLPQPNITKYDSIIDSNHDPFKQSNDHNEHQHGWGGVAQDQSHCSQPLLVRSVLDSSLVGKVGLQSYHGDLKALRRQQDMLELSQHEALLPGRNKALRSSADYVVTKMTIQQPFEILRNQGTIVLDRNNAKKNEDYLKQRQQGVTNGHLQHGFNHDQFVSSLNDSTSPIEEDPEALHLDQEFQEVIPQLHHKTWHQALKKHTINPSKNNTKNTTGAQHQGFDKSKLSGGLSAPALNKYGRVINPKQMSLDDFDHLLKTSSQNQGVLLQDYVKEQQRHQYDKFSGEGIASSDVILGIRGARTPGTTQHKVKAVIRDGFREINRPRVGAQIVNLDTKLESNVLDVAALIDDMEGRGISQIQARNDTIEALKKKGFKKNQLRYLTPRPLAIDLAPIDYSNPTASPGTYINDPRTMAEIEDKFEQADKKVYHKKQRLQVDNQGQMVDTIRLKKMQKLEKKLHSEYRRDKKTS